MNLERTLAGSYDELLAAAGNPRQRASLERIKAACDYLDANGLKISPATIEAYCADRDWDGPKAQSIRNSKHVLMRYVELRRSGQTVHTQVKKTGNGEPHISDESLRAYVQLLKQERDQAVAETSRIKAGLRSVPGIRVDDLLRAKLAGAPAPQLPAPASEKLALLPTQVAAIRALLDPARLAACGLELHKDRVRQQTTKNVLLEKGDVVALRSAIGG